MSERSWQLPELLRRAGIRMDDPVPDVRVTQVTDDSRQVREGALFVAIRGARADGHRFLAQAARRGARAVLLEEWSDLPEGIVRVRVAATRPLLGPLAHAFYEGPSEQMKLIGVTGTNGKTTVAWWVQHLLESAGVSCGLLGTVANRVGAAGSPAGQTTPDAVALEADLARMLKQGRQACAMEVSSHALDQHRTDGIRWAAAVFTNLTPEHLDYHGTLERYRQAKLRLFDRLNPAALAVVNLQDPLAGRILERVRGRCLTYAVEAPADLTARDLRCGLEGTEFSLVSRRRAFPVHSPLIGRHNVQNLLAALAAVTAVGVPLERALEGVAAFAGVPGRLERVDGPWPFPVFVDYAHTDDALAQVLTQLRIASAKMPGEGYRLLTVFGCGGDRDRSKRPRMGRVAAALSDRVILTNDNPRGEEPQAIVREILAGVGAAAAPVEVILDRREAIRAALEQVDERWLVLIAGKGHETGQVVGDRVIPFNDVEVAREILEQREAVPR